MKVSGFRKIYDERHRELRIGPNDEMFCIVEATHVRVNNNTSNWANEYTMWIMPNAGWIDTIVFGDWIPVCKIDWTYKYLHIAISRVGNGTIVDHVIGAHPFEYKDVMDISHFKKFLSKVLGNCNHVITSHI